MNCTTMCPQALCAPYSDTKSWEPWSFIEVPDYPQIHTHNIIWVQQEAHIKLIGDGPFLEPSSIYLSKSPGKWTPSRFPSGGPYGERYPFPEPSFTCLNFLIKFLLIKWNFCPSLKGPRKGMSPTHVPRKGPLWKQTPISRAVLSLSSGVPSKVKEPSLSMGWVTLLFARDGNAGLVACPCLEMLHFTSSFNCLGCG